MIGRRTFLLAGVSAGTLVVAGGGAGFVAQDRYRGWLHKILRRWLPGYGIDPEGFARFVEDYNVIQADAIKLRVFAVAESVADAKALLPGDMERRIEEEERRILTYFLIGSDFFDSYPDGPKTITYRGAHEACTNPFATF